MKKINLFKISLLSLGTIAVFSACSSGQAPEKAPEDVVKEGMNNLSDVRSANYEITADGTLNVDDSVASLAGFAELDMAAVLSGGYNFSDVKDPSFSLAVDLDLKEDGGDESVKAEMRFLKETLYFMLAEMSDFGGDVPSEMVESFIGKWWSIPVPGGSLDDLTSVYKQESEMTEEEKQLKALGDNTMFFKDVEYVKNEKAGGVKAYRYSVTLDKDAVTEFLLEVSKITGVAITEGDLGDLKDVLTVVDFSGDVWVGQEDMTLRKFSGALNIKDLEGVSADLDVSYEVSNLNEAVKVEEPSGASEFNPLGLLGGGF